MSINPRIAQLEAELAQLKEQEQRAVREYRQASADAWNEFIRSNPWKYASDTTTYTEFMTGDKFLAVRVTRWIDPTKLEEHMSGWPNTTPDERSVRPHGMTYYRTSEGILTHGGGGTHVLRSPSLCSDIEWSEFLSGRVPDKFKR